MRTRYENGYIWYLLRSHPKRSIQWLLKNQFPPPPWFLTPAATVLEYPQRLSFPRPASNQMWFPPSPVGRNFVGGGGGGIFRRTTSLTFLSQGFLIKRTGTKRRRRRSRDRLLFLNQANFRLLSLKTNFLRPCFPTKSWPVSCDTSPSFSQFTIFRLTLENFFVRYNFFVTAKNTSCLTSPLLFHLTIFWCNRNLVS